MPIYDFKCRGCGQEFELLVRGSIAPACPGCASPDLEQLLSTGIAVSSASIRQSNIQGARRKIQNSANYRDEKRAEMEEIKEHTPHLVTETKKP
jgi:putative FmdB family regulatory protein